MDQTMLSEKHKLKRHDKESLRFHQHVQNVAHRGCQMASKMWSKRQSHPLLHRMQKGVATLRDGFVVSYKN